MCLEIGVKVKVAQLDTQTSHCQQFLIFKKDTIVAQADCTEVKHAGSAREQEKVKYKEHPWQQPDRNIAQESPLLHLLTLCSEECQLDSRKATNSAGLIICDE